ncbi:metallophosphoesterase family protein [Candidatus Contubernalis alkaliaceticus]|uniref:metallophosphoesterase family protein n=1 Tax=Candidatus Contubernalis alkaliaceticus TaxID=338645 RepID=UPI001F4BD311|nr:metallophosphoesterase [Candidatus Contubernalis alkalaceticus]UNC90889.1 metallophosphoesterase [Candidatus Contubernalis alkalaceticus]
MRIAVFSDTHGNVIMMEKILTTMDSVDLLIHAGDFYQDAVKLSQRLPSLSVKAVVGNCDYPRLSPQELILELEGIRIYVIHGHSLDPGDFYNALIAEGKRVKAQLVIFGHTHLASRFEREGIIFLNPGSISGPRMGNGPSCGMVQLNDGVIEVEIIEVPRLKG